MPTAASEILPFPPAIPDGPYCAKPDKSDCGTDVTGTTTWQDIWMWFVGSDELTITLDVWAYNQTQRGVYYFQFDANDLPLRAVSQKCVQQGRIYTGGPTGVRAKFKYTPCGNNKDCGQDPDADFTFCKYREAEQGRSIDVTLNNWCIDEVYQTNKRISPSVYWTHPSITIGGFPFTFSPCYDTPTYISSGLGCYYDGYDCFGQGGGTPVWSDRQGRGYWSYDNQSNTWRYSTFWFTSNVRPGAFPCGQCTYCDAIAGYYCLCSYENVDFNNLSPNCNRGGPHAQTCNYDGGSYDLYCCGSAGDHDIWQTGGASVTITRGRKRDDKCDAENPR